LGLPEFELPMFEASEQTMVFGLTGLVAVLLLSYVFYGVFKP
jgi:hypothetical protein